MKGGETMKKEWQTPQLEVLSINMTMKFPDHGCHDGGGKDNGGGGGDDYS